MVEPWHTELKVRNGHILDLIESWPQHPSVNDYEDCPPDHVALEFLSPVVDGDQQSFELLERAGTGNPLIVEAISSMKHKFLRWVRKEFLTKHEFMDTAFHSFYEGHYQPKEVR